MTFGKVEAQSGPPPSPEPKRPTAQSSRRPESKDRKAQRGLVAYILYALVLHAMFFGLAAFREHFQALVVIDDIIEMEIGVDEPVQKPEGGGSDTDSPQPEPASPQQAKVVPVHVERAVEAEPEPEQPTEQAEETAKPDQAIEQVAPIERPIAPPNVPKVTIAAAARGASRGGGSYGTGPGRGGGSGGLGDGFGIKDDSLPVISGQTVFGSSKKGALRGTLCFIPVGTRKLSQVARCPPEAILYANQLNIPPRRFVHGFPGVSNRFEWFALDFKGRFTVAQSGSYKFRLASDDGAILWVDGKLVVNNDGWHPIMSRVGSIELEEGKHRLRVLYFQGPRDGIALQLFVTPPDGVERLWQAKL